MTNTERRSRAQAVLDVYPCEEPGDELQDLIDMLADLMHWAAGNEIDFANCLMLAQMHYEAEQDGESPR